MSIPMRTPSAPASALAAVLDKSDKRVHVSFATRRHFESRGARCPAADLLVSPEELRRDLDLVVTVDVPSVHRLGQLQAPAGPPSSSLW